MMRTFGVLTLLAVVGVATPHGVPSPRAAARAGAAEPPLLRGFHASSAVSVRMYLPAGTVRVRAWTHDSIAVRGRIAAGVSLFGGGNTDHIKFFLERNDSSSTQLASADLEVMIPVRARAWIKMVDGRIDVDGTQGELEAYAVGGSMTVTGARGVVSLESIDARVRVVGTRGDVRVRGSKAPVELSAVTGTATITTVSGDVIVTDDAPDSRIETIGGTIDWRGRLVRGAFAELQTHSGAIRFTLDTAHAPSITWSSRSGRVPRAVPTADARAGRISARSFKGDITFMAATAKRAR